MSSARLTPDGRFIISDYNQAKPWSSFFPGIAGLWGIPLWAFYVNRGQAIAGFGIRGKDEPIMEYWPANKAYQLVPSQGFRTFIKTGRRGVYEPFRVVRPAGGRATQEMRVAAHELEIVERDPRAGLEVSVRYFTVPGVSYAALTRTLTVTNISKKPVSLELLDGLTAILPCGINNWFMKEMSRTIEAWMTVEEEAGVCLFKLSTDPRDTSDVAFVKGANFYVSFREGQKPADSRVIVDPRRIFGAATDFSSPVLFEAKTPFAFPKDQIARNITPCAFTLVGSKLGRGQSVVLHTLVGHMFDVADVRRQKIAAVNAAFIDAKRRENHELIDGIMDRAFTASGSPLFDQYVRQTYLDNVLRGGLPVTLEANGRSKTVYVFSRKHGDLERDYNRFQVAPTYFSEGEGNYRDVNQNRRSDLFFEPHIGARNILDFVNLIQPDGYNPLVFKGVRYTVAQDVFEKSALASSFNDQDRRKLAHVLTKPFALGDLLRYMEENHIVSSRPREEFLVGILKMAAEQEEAAFGEGYWSDHWTYNMDLLENFRAVYPDRFRSLLLEEKIFTYFDTHAFLKPRAERYVLRHGALRQYHGVFCDEEKNALIQRRKEAKHQVRAGYGSGEVIRVTLFDKLLCLVVNKIATLDPSGVGIEMEADKPNWYDSLNGLPGLFGSSVSETFELKRLVLFLREALDGFKLKDDAQVPVLAEVAGFMRGLQDLLAAATNDFDYWDQANTLKETYRLKARAGFDGKLEPVTIGALRRFFDLALKKIQSGIDRSLDPKTSLYTTYFTHTAVAHETRTDASGKSYPAARAFQMHRLPLFLEGIVHALRTEKKNAASIHQATRRSPLRDKKLGMYKVNASLAKESFEIGRTKAFPPGWLENESVWLHMEYKYLLELLKNGLYKEFYRDFFEALVPFQKPEVYGRSVLENSSFIVSSAHPDASLHGTGFVARLSGSTAELVHMWLLMNMGPSPFFMAEGKICLRLAPALAASLFTKKSGARRFMDARGGRIEEFCEAGTYSFLLFGRTLVTYVNPRRKDTFGPSGVKPSRFFLYDNKGLVFSGQGDIIPAPWAQNIRSGAITRLRVELG